MTRQPIFSYLLLALAALTMLFPFGWMLLTSLQPASVTVTAPQLTWSTLTHWENYARVWRDAAFSRYCLNSLLVTGLAVSGQLVTGILAAFAFTHLHFYGRRWLFRGLVLLLLVPGELLLIPNFITLAHLHWVNTYAALIIPWTTSIFVVVALRQAFQMQPRSTYYAARIDGASDWQYIWHVLVPAQAPVIVTVALLQIIGSWNAFMWPLIVTNSDSLRTLPVGLMAFTDEAGTNYPLLMAASVLVILPLLILYLLGQKYLIVGRSTAHRKDSSL